MCQEREHGPNIGPGPDPDPDRLIVFFGMKVIDVVRKEFVWAINHCVQARPRRKRICLR